MKKTERYSIGTPNEPWGPQERKQWLALQEIKRSYKEQVVDRLDGLKNLVDVMQYGSLSYDTLRYPLFIAHSLGQTPDKPTALITGGVHGYETSGVLGALRFIETQLTQFSENFNLIVAPCISPWGFETINRWNPFAVDPNRSFFTNGDSEEARCLMQYVQTLNANIVLHIDLHETTDSDNSEFRPALAARDNVEHEVWDIPDGFYLVGDSLKPCDDFQTHIVNCVSKVTHIAPCDKDGRIIGEKVTQAGVINYPNKELGLCAGFTDAHYTTTTEVYPDSPRVDEENCILAQVEAVRSALEFADQNLY